MQFHIWVNYYGSIQIISHPFTSLFPINMIFECRRLVPFSGLCTQQLYNSVNYFLKKTHLTIKWPSFFPLSRKYGGVKVSKHQQTFRVWSWFPCRCNIRSDHTNDVPLYFSSAWNASPYKLIKKMGRGNSHNNLYLEGCCHFNIDYEIKAQSMNEYLMISTEKAVVSSTWLHCLLSRGHEILI